MLRTHEAHAAFYQLSVGRRTCMGLFEEDEDVEPIFGFDVTTSSSGLGPIVTSFNNFRYTVLVPTKEAFDKALPKTRNYGLGSGLVAGNRSGQEKSKDALLAETSCVTFRGRYPSPWGTAFLIMVRMPRLPVMKQPFCVLECIWEMATS